MVTHNVTMSMGVGSHVTVGTEVILVKRPSELAPALRQQERPVVIEDAQMEQRFQRLLKWREARNWFVAVLGAGLIAFAISMNYKIEIGFEKDFKLERMNGKITL